MEPDDPGVSIVVPTYSRPEKLVEAFKSILNQPITAG
jgi:glycosyltransferase involved in cell wall biosynthesis